MLPALRRCARAGRTVKPISLRSVILVSHLGWPLPKIPTFTGCPCCGYSIRDSRQYGVLEPRNSSTRFIRSASEVARICAASRPVSRLHHRWPVYRLRRQTEDGQCAGAGLPVIGSEVWMLMPACAAACPDDDLQATLVCSFACQTAGQVVRRNDFDFVVYAQQVQHGCVLHGGPVALGAHDIPTGFMSSVPPAYCAACKDGEFYHKGGREGSGAKKGMLQNDCTGNDDNRQMISVHLRVSYHQSV